MQVVTLIARLADGAWHRVDDMKETCRQLEALGLDAEVMEDRCRLAYPLDLLDQAAIATLLPPGVELDVAAVVDSTNTRLAQRPPPPVGTTSVLAAEFQYGGRGRLQRKWVSPYASGVCLSLAQQLEPPPDMPAALSLVTGVATLRALRELAVTGVGLKWPNDIVWRGAKLGGVLLEASTTAAGLHVVTGIGINVRLPGAAAEVIAGDGGIEATDLHAIDPALCLRRNELTAALVSHTRAALTQFASDGFAPFREQWNDADVLNGSAVSVSGADTITGVAGGINESGALVVRSGNMTHHLVAGDVRVRET
ncbi:MAG: biotin--[acetyl-CoA-carboxylase] ligase [Gammaproteobacteria bacterium]|nr:biotin--[acetyl-CoA-carboxylase] ligase [Gammaproteobacteria bacterium]